MRYRVDELAGRCGMSVDTIRFYQTRGLLPPPQREGRIAWYSQDHLERLRRIRELKHKGFTLASIRRLLEGELDRADEALVEAVVADEKEDELMTLDELADRVGVAPAVLRAIEQEQLLLPRLRDGVPVYTASDAAAAKAGLTLLETGLPLSELLVLAHEHDQSARRTAKRAVDMFDDFVRARIRRESQSDEEAADKLVEAFTRMLPATVSLVAHHFRQVLLHTAQARIEGVSDESLGTLVGDERQ